MDEELQAAVTWASNQTKLLYLDDPEQRIEVSTYDKLCPLDSDYVLFNPPTFTFTGRRMAHYQLNGVQMAECPISTLVFCVDHFTKTELEFLICYGFPPHTAQFVMIFDEQIPHLIKTLGGYNPIK